MSAARAKNTASTDEIRKLLKAELDGLGATKFMTTNMDKLVADYVVFMAALIKLTLRPSKKMLEAAAKAAFSKFKVDRAGVRGLPVLHAEAYSTAGRRWRA